MLLSLPDELLSLVGFHLSSGSDCPSGPPSSLASLLGTHSTVKRALSFDTNPSLYADILHETFDTEAVVRRYGRGVLADARLAACELKTRWALLRRIRTPLALDGETPATNQQLNMIADDLMHVFMLLTENDGRNIGHVLDWARLPRYLNNFHQNVMIPIALEPGYPDDTPEKALHVTLAFWLDEAAYFLKQKAYATLSSADEEADPEPENEDAFQETPAQIDEKVFVTRPFALALHKFDPYFAPWTAREVPLPKALDVSDPPANDPHLADLRPRRRAVPMSRFQREYSICPPVLTLSASMGLMNQLDRTPCVGGLSESSSNSSTSSLSFLYPFGETPPAAVEGEPFVVDPHTDSVLRQSVPVINLPSKCHDLDVRRLLACGDPWQGGLDALTFQGKIEGRYHGSFAFFDFAGYRDMLGGDMRTLYEGTFGQQAQQIKLSERIVRVHKSLVGGTGPLINAGFPLPGTPSDPYTVCYTEEEQGPEPKGSEYAKEMYIDGTGRSGWGHFKLTGRVRPWDGMITLVKEYTTNDAAGNPPSTRGKWLYRGYIMQDSRFVGCWRDSFTDCSFRGYEGSFHLRKQTDAFLVPFDASAVAGSSRRVLSDYAPSTRPRVLDTDATDAISRPEADSAEGLVLPKGVNRTQVDLEMCFSSLASNNASLSQAGPSTTANGSHASSLPRVLNAVSTTAGVPVVGLTADIDPARLLEICPGRKVSPEAESTEMGRLRGAGKPEEAAGVGNQRRGKETEASGTAAEVAEKKRKRASWSESWGEADPAEWEKQWHAEFKVEERAKREKRGEEQEQS